MNRRFFLLNTFLLILLSCSPPVPKNTAPADYPRYWNDVARYLGGMDPEPNSALSSLETRPEAEAHREFFKENWNRLEASQLGPMGKWAETELPSARFSNRTVFYPFSGPDVMTITTFFPYAPQYIMFGLEETGSPPDPLKIPAEQLPEALLRLQTSLHSILNYSFFQTLRMAVDLQQNILKGAGPILMAFLARTGYRIVDVQMVEVDPAGTVTEIKDAAENGRIKGIRITFYRPSVNLEIKLQTLTYFSVDISNKNADKIPEFFAMIDTLRPTTTYIKSASYLMHNENFEKIRGHVLNISDWIMQDDSGIPFKYYSEHVWDLSFYGAYRGPIQLFAESYQNDLNEAFLKGAKPLPFGIGYRYNAGDSNLMTVVKKKR